MKEFERDSGFGNLPHYYDEDFTERQSLGGLLVKELCPICKAHLSHYGICLNACHLPKEIRDRFVKMMTGLSDKSKEVEK